MSLIAGMKSLVRSPTRAAAPSALDALTLSSSEGWGLEDVDVTATGVMSVAAANRCIQVLCNSMAILPVYIYRESDKKHFDSHPLGHVLWERPNECMGPMVYTRTMMASNLLSGNDYAWIHRHPATGRVMELIPLDPHLVTSMVMQDGKLWYWYADPKSGDLITIPKEDMIHHRAWCTDGLDGVAPIRFARTAISSGQAAARHELSTWRNAARPDGVLVAQADLNGEVIERHADGTTETITKKERLRRAWEKAHRGPDNAWRIAVLDSGVEYKPITMSAADTQYVETSELRVIDICRFFGVPPYLCYAGKESYESNEQHAIDFVNYTLSAYDRQWQQEDTYKLMTVSDRRDGLVIARNMKMLLKGDVKTQAEWIKTMREVGGYDVDEIRALDDRGPVPGGDVRLASWNFGPLDVFRALSMARAGGESNE